MKISFLYGSIANGGAERVITALANDFANKENVSIITLDDGNCGYMLSSSVKVVPLNVMHMSKSSIDALMSIIRQVNAIKSVLIRLSPDVIIAFDVKLAIFAHIALGRRKCIVIGSERSNPYFSIRSFKERLFVKFSSTLDGFVFQTEGAKHFYPKKIQDKSIVIPNGIFSKIPDNPKAFSERKPFSIVATGRLAEVKRYDVMIDAMKKIVECFPLAKLDIFGSGNDETKIRERIISSGMENNVFLRGRIENVPEVLVEYQIFLLASEYEGMPNGLIEAMASGCVCISSDCPFGPSDLIRHGVNGYLYPVGSTESIVKYVSYSFLNPSLADTIGKNAEKIQDNLKFEVIAEQYYDYILMKLN